MIHLLFDFFVCTNWSDLCQSVGICNYVMFMTLFVSTFVSIGPQKPHLGNGELIKFFCRYGLKCHYNQIFDYIFVHSKSFLKILPNFNLLRTLEMTFFE